MLTTLEDILDTVHIERQSEAQGLVERVRLGCSDNVAGIKREYVHLESGYNGEVLTVALVFCLIVIAGAKGELIIVGILGSDAPLHLLQLLLESAGGIAETLEDTTD